MFEWEKATDEVMAYCDLKEDPMFSKIKNKSMYIRGSFKIAGNVANHYQAYNLSELLKKDSVEIFYHNNEQKNDRFFSEIHSQIYYNTNQKMIDIFLPCLRDKADALHQFGISISLEELVILHIAHEFYHFYEFKYDKRTFEMLPKAEYKTMGFIRRKAEIHQCSEIAAHRFAQLVTQAPIHPKLMDYIYLIQKGVCQEADVNRLIKEASELI